MSPKTLSATDCNTLCFYAYKKWLDAETRIRLLRNYFMIQLMLDAGLRVGELVQLVVSDVWFNDAPVRCLIIRPEIAKNKKERSVPLSSKCNYLIHEYLSRFILLASEPSFFLFPSKSSPVQHISTRQVERMVYAYSLLCLGRPVNPHVLRHTFATRLRRVTDIRTVQELLGHSNIQSTMIYTHPDQEDKVKAIESLDVKGRPYADCEPDASLAHSISNHLDTARTDRTM